MSGFNFLEKLKNRQYLSHFLIINLTYIGYGALFGGLGPMIPYLAAESHLLETQYSFIFTARSLGMLTATVIYKIMDGKCNSLTYHTISAFSCVAMGIFSIIFSSSVDPFISGFAIFFSGLAYSSLEVTLNVCSLIINPEKQIQFWLLLTHSSFGIGALIGPYFVYLFQLSSYAFMGMFCMIPAPFFIYLISPEFIRPQVAKSIRGSHLQIKSEENNKTVYVSRRVELLLSLMLFIYVGMECAYGGWISSYAVMAHIATKESATKFTSIYWIGMTAFRFGMAFVDMKTSVKMVRLIELGIATSVLALILKSTGYTLSGCYIASILYGLSDSVIYALVFSLTLQFGLSLAPSQTITITMFSVIGQGVLSMAVGILMKIFTIDMLFISILFMLVIFYACNKIVMKFLQEESPKQIQIQLTQKLTNGQKQNLNI